jgi:transposase
MKTEARDEARNMRREGASIREIEQRLGVARSSVSRWVSGVQLTPQQLAELERRSGAGRLAGAAVNAERAHRYSKYSQKKRTNLLPYGTATLTVHSTRILQTLYGSIQELGDFNRPEWLG